MSNTIKIFVYFDLDGSMEMQLSMKMATNATLAMKQF